MDVGDDFLVRGPDDEADRNSLALYLTFDRHRHVDIVEQNQLAASFPVGMHSLNFRNRVGQAGDNERCERQRISGCYP